MENTRQGAGSRTVFPRPQLLSKAQKVGYDRSRHRHQRGHYGAYRERVRQLSLIRDLYSRFAHIGAEGLKFCVVGGFGAILQFLIQDTLHFKLGVGALTAETFGIAAGIVVTFFGNRYWTYADKRSNGREFIRETWQFLLWCLLGLGIQLGLQAIATYSLGFKSGLAYNVVTAFGIGIATVFRFWAYRTFVFTAVKPPATAEELQPEPTP
jgi:putative flippase GtrA